MMLDLVEEAIIFVGAAVAYALSLVAELILTLVLGLVGGWDFSLF